ncbi:MAG: pilus assembly protein N-terminal domain-containing protein, partial [Candidatus Omnitrophica bacterium]|nr:pilus assembly protein N-terminal domain-containing protein [Candidatus Omnitrophota bacterium]
MSRTVSIIGLVAFLFFGSLVTTSGATEYPRTYKLYIELGKEAIDAKNYTEAEKYFKFAQMVAPSADEPVSYLSLIKRLREGRVEPFEKGRSTDEVLGSFQKNPELKEIYASPEKEKPGPQAKESTPTRKVYETYSKSTELEPANKLDYAPAKQKKPVSGESSSKSIIQNEELLELDADLWSRQPNTMVNVALQSTLVFEGSNITRFLVITPGIVEASQVNRDQIRITPLKRGNTFLHVWDDTGRWTFRIEVVLPVSLTSTPDKVSTPEEEKVKYAKPFRFDYSTDWGSFYEGDSLDSAERTDVNFIQYFSLTGETPYGDFDTSAVVNKNEDQNEVSAFSVGIEDGSWGDFN